jgi:class 3 adenylate cyclase/tetratricopeptide (TPR) repeat protein
LEGSKSPEYASRVIPCPSCGHENEAGDKFCSQCGAALVEQRPAGGTERKIVTVLFADLVGFTSQSEKLDPEDVQAILRPYHERLRVELERWGGTVEKFIGDAVMALFGAPVTREDDPERAVRAALAIRDWVVEEGELQVRIAINTGEALVNLGARPELGEGMAAGDVINTASRLQSAAPVNGILVGETTYRTTSARIDYREHPAVEAKGKEAAIPVWEVVAARARFGVDLAPEERTPLIGRERELDQLVGALERVRRERTSELVTLIGVPGIGKSRLLGELFNLVERGDELAYWRQGRSLPYGEGVSFWALAEMVKAQAGILETDTDQEAEAKLERAVAELVDEDAGWVLSQLRPLVGLAASAAGSQEEAFAAWRRFFEALADQHPLLLVFEDLQWADEGLLDFIEELADWVRDVPMLILCSGRVELLERRPAWGGGKPNVANISLRPLSEQETAKLIAALIGSPVLDADTQTALLERADGNPLYAEQFVRMLDERGTTEDVALPDSVQGIIAARLDALAPQEKALLQDAAVVGKVFWLGAVGATEQQLHALRQKELVQRARRSSVEGETEYAFKHVLVRDVAYGQIPRADRAQKHLRAAEWIESLGRPEDHAEMLAHHYVNALELGRATKQDVGAIVERARDALQEAGDRALALSALPQAERYYAAALELRRDPEVLLRYGRAKYSRDGSGADELEEARAALASAGDPEAAAEASLMLADIEWFRGNHERMVAELATAKGLVDGRAPSRAQVAVLANVARYDMLAARLAPAVETGEQALALAERLGLDELRAHALNSIGVAKGAMGDVEGAAALEESAALASEVNAIADVLRGRNNLSAFYYLHGDLVQSEAIAAETIELAHRYGQHRIAHFLESGPRVGNLFSLGLWDDALELADVVTRAVEEGSGSYGAGTSYAVRAAIRLARDQADAAVTDADRAVELTRTGGDPQQVLPDLAFAALVFASTHNEQRAADVLTRALENLRSLTFLGFGALDLPFLACAACELGRQAELGDALEREPFKSPWLRAAEAVLSGDSHSAAEIFDGMGFRAQEAFFRLRAGSEQDVRAAIGFYRGVGATRYVLEGESLLAMPA